MRMSFFMCASGRYECFGSPERSPFQPSTVDQRPVLLAAGRAAVPPADRRADAARADALHGLEVDEGFAVIQTARSSLFRASAKSRCAWTTS